MARAIWKGSLSFGLVNVPVGLYTATQDKTIHFNQFEEGTSDRIRYKRVNERTGEEVDYARIVKGVDLGGGEFAILTPDELDAAAPEKSRTIDIEGFVDLADIDPIYYRTTYFLAPEGDAARRAYALLRKAMQESNKVGIATFVMRNKEYLVAIRPEDEVIALETMYFADEIRTPSEELPNLSTDGKFTAKELDMAQLLIDSLAQDFDPTKYHDDYRRQVEELVETKRQGGVIETAPRPARSSNVVDLLEALQASVEDAGRRPASDRTKPAAGAKRASKRSTAASKAPARSSAKRDRVGAVPATVAKKSTARKPAAKKATTGSTPRRKAS
jgi:DNA end-binding protein Ku